MTTEDLLADILGELLDKVEVEIRPADTAKLVIDDDRDRQCSKKNVLALHDIGQRAEHAFMSGGLWAQIPAAFHQAVRMQVPAVVFDKRLNCDVARLIARPVGEEAAGRVGSGLAPVAIGIVLTVDRIGLPGRVRAIQGGVASQRIFKHVVEHRSPVCHRDGGLRAGYDSEIGGEIAGGVERCPEFKADSARLFGGD